MNGRFITVEGIEGVGKSTVIGRVCEELQATGKPVTLTREPGGTRLAEKIRQVVLDIESEEIPDAAELLLMFAARAVHLENLIKPALLEGRWVVCDRFTDATYAYQGSGRGISREAIAGLENLVQGELRPDLTLLLDAPVETGLERVRRRGGADRFEVEQLEFFERVRQGYLAIAAAEPDRVRVIDAGRKLADVETDVLTVIQDYIKE